VLDITGAPGRNRTCGTRIRKQSNVHSIKSFWLDIDCGEGKPYATKRDGFNALKTFYSKTGLPLPTVITSSGNGLYAHWLLHEPINADTWEKAAQKFKHICDVSGFKADPSRTADSASVLRLPGTHNRKNGMEMPVVSALHGETISFDTFSEKLLKAEVAYSSIPLITQGEKKTATGVYPETSAEKIASKCSQIAFIRDAKGNVSEPLWYAGIGVLRHCKESHAIIHEWSNGHPNYSQDETDAKIAQHKMPPTTCKYFEEIEPEKCAGCEHKGKVHSPAVLGYAVPIKLDEGIPAVCTDVKISKHFAARFDGLVKYWPNRGHFLVYDGTRFSEESPGGAYPLLNYAVQDLNEKARGLPDENQRIARLKELLKLESHQRQTAILEAAKNLPELIVTSSMLDNDPMLLNVGNGTIDLRKGILCPHSYENLITKKVDIHFDESAECPAFLAFLRKIMDYDEELVSYVQRWMGYCLTGRTTEQVLLFLYGTGRNGKSTLVNIMKKLLGDFSATADGGIVLNSNNGDLNSLASLAALRGTRLAALNEINDGDRLNEAAVKNITGQDEISCRFLHREFFSYRPTFKLVLFGNYKPNIRGRDYGVWRRIHLLNFKVTITDQECDPDLEKKLNSELPGILSWAVKGCLDWQQHGLNPPQAVKAAVDEYRKTEDVIQAWIDECCDTGLQYVGRSRELLESFMSFSNWRGLSSNRFGRMLNEKGFEKSKGGAGERQWRGIKLKPRT
jgi:putative DNA primase/helicase